MLWTPQFGDSKIVSNSGIVGTSVPGTSVPDAASVNTYGAVTQLISAANNVQDSWGIEILVLNTLNPSALVGEMAIDILIGGATDDVLIKSLLVGGSFYGGGRSYFFPIHIPGGVRIAAQLAAGAAQTTEPRVLCYLYGGPPPMQIGRKVTTYGTKANDARGLAVTPAASGGAAAVTQMTAATTEDHFYWMPGFQVSGDTTIANATMTNVGIGLGASTEDRIGSWWFSKNASEMQSGPFPAMGVYRDVPSGTRVSLLTSSGAAIDSGHDGHIYAVS